MFKADPAKSEKARADGNASFKKGRWVEAIGHYTTSIVANPEDPLPYTNRAAAYLKLDKYADAERDCTSALDRAPGHLKALYRRGLARKGLERYDDAIAGVYKGHAELIADLESVLAVEQNEMASSELEEIRELLVEQEDKARKKKQAKARLPPSPPRASASIQELPDDEPAAAVLPNAPVDAKLSGASSHTTLSAKLDTVSLTDEAVGAAKTKPKGTFADLRKSRGERKTYISNGTAPQRSGPTLETAPAVASASTSESPSSPTKTSIPSREPAPPPDPNSTSSSSGFHLLRTISPLIPAETWSYLQHYPPENIPKMLSSLLEPESLGQLLLALRHGADKDAARVRVLLQGLKSTDRWRINLAMLSRKERAAGDEAWQLGGAEGGFA